MGRARDLRRRGATGVLALVLGACDPDVAGDDDGGVLQGIEVTLPEAIAIARDEVSDGDAFDAELDIEQRTYDVDLLDDDHVAEVWIDAEAGAVMDVLEIFDGGEVEEAEEATELLALPTSCTLEDAIAAAEDAGDGTAAAIEVEDGEFAVTVIARDRTQPFVIVSLDCQNVEIADAPPDD
jgi:hypothetical protein